jgi:hypothetical protein
MDSDTPMTDNILTSINLLPTDSASVMRNKFYMLRDHARDMERRAEMWRDMGHNAVLDLEQKLKESA